MGLAKDGESLPAIIAPAGETNMRQFAVRRKVIKRVLL